MAYALYIPEHLDKVFFKLSKKDRKQLGGVHRKINEILENPYYYKPLRGDMHGARRVHIDKSFVLTQQLVGLKPRSSELLSSKIRLLKRGA